MIVTGSSPTLVLRDRAATDRNLRSRRGVALSLKGLFPPGLQSPTMGERPYMGTPLADGVHQPAVFLDGDRTPNRLHRPLPAAFPNRRALILLDWDDTLCPTTWISQILKAHMADSACWAMGSSAGCEVDWHFEIPAWFGQPLPDEPSVRDPIAELQREVIKLINVAQRFGVVVIVTNAVHGWVESTTKKWLPELKQYILGHGARPPIKVLYGQLAYAAARKHNRKNCEDLPWVDGLGELMWWKKVAMDNAIGNIEELYRLSPASATLARWDWNLPFGATLGGTSHCGSVPSMDLPLMGYPLTPLSGDFGAASSSASMAAVPWHTDGNAKRLVSLISIGDSEAEMQAAFLSGLGAPDLRAAQIAAQQLQQQLAWQSLMPPLAQSPWAGSDPLTPVPPPQIPVASPLRRPQSNPPAGSSRLPAKPWVKVVKLQVNPSVFDLAEELRHLALALPKLISTRSHVRLESEDLQHLPAPVTSRFPEESTLRRGLWTQTV